MDEGSCELPCDPSTFLILAGLLKRKQNDNYHQSSVFPKLAVGQVLDSPENVLKERKEQVH